MMKFQRNYRLTIDSRIEGEAIVIQPPLTVEFDIVRSTLSSVNQMSINIYNLAPRTRSLIFKDRISTTGQSYRRVTFEAGYGQLTKLFQGTLYEGSSGRSGPNFSTNIVGNDGADQVQNTLVSQLLAAGSTTKDIIKYVANEFSNMSLGKIGNFDTAFLRPVVLDGNGYAIIKKYTGNQCFIDMEKLNALKYNEAFVNEGLAFIDATNGLLETPRKDGGNINVKMLFEPRILMGQQVVLYSTTLPEYNGEYKVIGVRHHGVISEGVNGECVTDLQLAAGNQLFNGLEIIS